MRLRDGLFLFLEKFRRINFYRIHSNTLERDLLVSVFAWREVSRYSASINNRALSLEGGACLEDDRPTDFQL